MQRSACESRERIVPGKSLEYLEAQLKVYVVFEDCRSTKSK